MAAAFFNRLADPSKAHAVSAGTRPADQVHPIVVNAMRDAGIDIASATPQRLTDEISRGATLLVTMGCGDECPYVPGLQVEDWPLEDPKDRPPEVVQRIRDEIAGRVDALIRAHGWA